MIPLIVAAGICIALGQFLAVQMLVKKQEQSRGCLINWRLGNGADCAAD